MYSRIMVAIDSDSAQGPALTTAVAGAGLQAAQVLFYGFLPPKTVARQKLLQGWQQVDYAVVLYEAPHRIDAALAAT